jgi:hypothetical protein
MEHIKFVGWNLYDVGRFSTVCWNVCITSNSCPIVECKRDKVREESIVKILCAGFECLRKQAYRNEE